MYEKVRHYKGYEINENMECVGISVFVVFGEMDDGTKCYHKVVEGVEQETVWYSRARIDGNTCFFLEGE